MQYTYFNEKMEKNSSKFDKYQESKWLKKNVFTSIAISVSEIFGVVFVNLVGEMKRIGLDVTIESRPSEYFGLKEEFLY